MNEIVSNVQEHMDVSTPGSYIISAIILILFYLSLIVLCYFAWKLLQKLNHKIFENLEKQKGRSMSLEFLERIISFGITFFFLILPFNWDDIGKSIFGSAAVLTAIIGLAGQDVIKDILAGIQISMYKPFDIGDRIELDDGTSGIVEKITMRHIVLKRIDTLRVVIPNSKMNEYSVVNYSYEDVPRSVLLKFPVSFRANIRKTKQVIEQTVKNSPLTIPGKRMADGTFDYAPAYFIDLGNSALIISVTVYYEDGTPTEVLKDEINSSVFDALAENSIEIPYNYTNVVMRNE